MGFPLVLKYNPCCPALCYYPNFLFDIMMANPPFAGDIKESVIVSSYDLVRDKVGKGNKGVGRDILFIERNLDFLKPGGRMAVVLPQGRFNNSSDKYIRDFIADRCRILAVVGLHGNTFKPHTGTKTSVLFLQKWNDDPHIGSLCPRKEDYNIFFATMQKSGKDNSGDKIYVKRSDGSGDFLLDEHGHRIVDHDLFNHDGLTQDGIAEAFMEFAKKEVLSFFDLGSSVMPFDAEKYKRLMDELEVSELTFNDVVQDNHSFRFDSEYFKKEYLNFFNGVKSYQYLSEFVEFGYRVVYETTEIINTEDGKSRNCPIFLQATDISTPFINTNNLFYVEESDWIRYKNGRVTHGELLIEVKGKAEKIAIVPEDFPEKVLVSGTLYKLTTNEKINKYYLLIYLICKYGASFRERYKSNLLISFISKNDLYRLPVPTRSNTFEFQIENLFKLLIKSKNLSLDFYKQAEDLLLSELGLKDWQPTEETVAVKSFAESFLSSGRLDAEYYQPKYDDLASHFNKFKKLKIRQIIKYPVSSGSTPKAGGDDYTDAENGIAFVRAVDLKDGRVDTSNFIYIKKHIHEVTLKKTQLKKNDVLLSIAGTVGRCAIFEHDFEANINQAVSILRFDEQEINRLYLGLAE